MVESISWKMSKKKLFFAKIPEKFFTSFKCCFFCEQNRGRALLINKYLTGAKFSSAAILMENQFPGKKRNIEKSFCQSRDCFILTSGIEPNFGGPIIRKTQKKLLLLFAHNLP